MKQRHLHFRISEREYRFLTELAQECDEPVAAIMRRLIRAAIRTRDKQQTTELGTAPVPQAFRSSQRA